MENWLTLSVVFVFWESEIKFWQTSQSTVLKHYHWSPADLLFALRKILQTTDLHPCTDESALVAYVGTALSLRWPSPPEMASSPASHRAQIRKRKTGLPSTGSENQNSKIDENQKSFSLALRLCQDP